MSEGKNITEPPPEKEIPQDEFSVEVIIQDLPYVFKGKAPAQIEEFEWGIYIPQWQQEAEKIQQYLVHEDPDRIPLSLRRELRDFADTNGRIGRLTIDPAFIKSSIAGLYIGDIESKTWIIQNETDPEKPNYRSAKGIGSFLMNNLCAFADIKGWKIFAYPYPDGEMSQEAIVAWNLRKGFRSPIGEEHEAGSMVRDPREPDKTQPILSVLSSVPLARAL